MTRVTVSQMSSPSRVLINERGPKVKRRATLQYSHYLAPESQRGRPCPHMSRDAFPRFFDSDEPEQRHRVLIEFGLCAGVALHPLRACPFISSWLEHFLAKPPGLGFLCRTGFQFDAIYRPPHAATAGCRSKSMHARVPPSIIHARTLSIVAYRPFARVCLFGPRIPPFSSHSDQHSAGGIANGVGAHRT